MDGSVATFHRTSAPRSGIAERIWNSARAEFSRRGYHGARVQGIARGAVCNVALIYRHWSSKKALYLDILRAVWIGTANDIARLVADGPVGAAAIVDGYLDAMMKDQQGSQLLIREYLDGAPHLLLLAQNEPALLEPVKRAAAALAIAGAPGGDTDPVLAVVTIGGLAALVASAQDAARPFVSVAPTAEVLRAHVRALLLHGLAPANAPQ